MNAIANATFCELVQVWFLENPLAAIELKYEVTLFLVLLLL
jgi:hypothetical protein